jgi:hypothetical protein
MGSIGDIQALKVAALIVGVWLYRRAVKRTP